MNHAPNTLHCSVPERITPDLQLSHSSCCVSAEASFYFLHVEPAQSVVTKEAGTLVHSVSQVTALCSLQSDGHTHTHTQTRAQVRRPHSRQLWVQHLHIITCIWDLNSELRFPGPVSVECVCVSSASSRDASQRPVCLQTLCLSLLPSPLSFFSSWRLVNPGFQPCL